MATVKEWHGSSSSNAVQRLDADFSTAVEQVVQQQQELDVGLRQLQGSPRTPNPTDTTSLSPSQHAVTVTAADDSTAAGAATAAAAAASVSRPKSASRGAAGTDDPSWNEFIERQGMFLLMKDAKTAEVAAQMSRVQKPQVRIKLDIIAVPLHKLAKNPCVLYNAPAGVQEHAGALVLSISLDIRVVHAPVTAAEKCAARNSVLACTVMGCILAHMLVLDNPPHTAAVQPTLGRDAMQCYPTPYLIPPY